MLGLLLSTNSTMTSSKLVLAGGKIVPVLANLIVTREELVEIWKRLAGAVHPVDILLLTLVGFFSVPISCVLFGMDKERQQDSYLYLFVTHLAQLAQLAILVYLVDCWVVVFNTLGFNIRTLNTLSTGFAKILYICWCAQRLSVMKRYFLGKLISRKTDSLGRAAAIDKLIDGVIFSCTCFFLLDVLDVDMGVGITSIFAFGSAGTLVIGLASQSLATMFVNGLVLTTSDRIAEGDHIKFGNGNNGQIKKIGWFQTTLKHYDDLIEVIPNSELGMQRVTNLSRVKVCRVRQALRIQYEDAEKLDDLLPDILEEIKKSCPKVICDGSAVFRAVWTDFKEDHLRVVVEVHFQLPPMGNSYWNNRQECLKAIYRACKKHEVRLVSGIYPQGIN